MDFKEDKRKATKPKPNEDCEHATGKPCHCGGGTVEDPKYSQQDVQETADQRENMLDDTEKMYEENDEPTERPKTTYDIFDINTIRDTYLGIKNVKAEQGVKGESRFKNEVPIHKMKQEGKAGDADRTIYGTKSFYERLGPQYEDMPIQSKSNFFDRYMMGVHNDKLKKVFLKREFYSLQIIGQFNMGFVCATLNNSRDLFILDQHATHERHNLETYNRELKIASQIVMFPISLKIDKSLAGLLPKYAFIFDYNGLKFNLPEDFDEQLKTGTVKIKLISLPQSCDLQFDESDFLDLLTALRTYDEDCQKAGGVELLDRYDLIGQLRPRKIHGILALRACKGAIFIGEQMNRRSMRELVDHLRPLRRPWICAHGRPTMRYLMNFDNFKAEFALPSRVQTDKTKYCSVSRKYRQRPPRLVRQIGDREQRQIQSSLDIYPTEELIELKKQFLKQKQYYDKYEAPRIEEARSKSAFKYVVQEDPKKFQGDSILDKVNKPIKELKEGDESVKKEKIKKITEFADDNLKVDNTQNNQIQDKKPIKKEVSKQAPIKKDISKQPPIKKASKPIDKAKDDPKKKLQSAVKSLAQSKQMSKDSTPKKGRSPSKKCESPTKKVEILSSLKKNNKVKQSPGTAIVKTPLELQKIIQKPVITQKPKEKATHDDPQLIDTDTVMTASEEKCSQTNETSSDIIQKSSELHSQKTNLSIIDSIRSLEKTLENEVNQFTDHIRQETNANLEKGQSHSQNNTNPNQNLLKPPDSDIILSKDLTDQEHL